MTTEVRYMIHLSETHEEGLEPKIILDTASTTELGSDLFQRATQAASRAVMEVLAEDDAQRQG